VTGDSLRVTDGIGGRRAASPSPSNVPGGMADPQRVRFDHLMRQSRPRWADERNDLPCQQPGVDPDWWFESGVSKENKAVRQKAQRLCRGCPMRKPCRAKADENKESWGIWGGVLMERPGRPSPIQRKGAAP
jgi:hypothetical protein